MERAASMSSHFFKKDYQHAGTIEKHCEKMKRIGPDILKANGSTLQMTPYISEAR